MLFINLLGFEIVFRFDVSDYRCLGFVNTGACSTQRDVWHVNIRNSHGTSKVVTFKIGG